MREPRRVQTYRPDPSVRRGSIYDQTDARTWSDRQRREAAAFEAYSLVVEKLHRPAGVTSDELKWVAQVLRFFAEHPTCSSAEEGLEILEGPRSPRTTGA